MEKSDRSLIRTDMHRRPQPADSPKLKCHAPFWLSLLFTINQYPRAEIAAGATQEFTPMRIPFPSNLRVGTDIIAHNRLLKSHASRNYLQRLATRFLHPYELADLDKRFPDWQSFEALPVTKQVKLSAHLAGRWAAKEAAKKAWGANLLSFKDLRTETLPSGEVQIICQSYRESDLSHSENQDEPTTPEQVAKLSISHDGDYAVATVIATPLHPDILKDLHRRKADAVAKVTATKNTPAID